ncbi:protein CREG1 isoform X1 [Bradysia coprophila]|uniref:protein CREG1 isoform X1 n=2 Tax=Bradysia coprophila TaxID=38358 RepID=UPI00187D8B23|nr:protein CREG1 isoform X1 [Bradysia coprophila]
MEKAENRTMETKIVLELLFIGTLIACSCALTIRDFGSNELNDVEPDHKDYPAVARYVVHKSEWASMGTLSTLKSINGFPMVNIISVADSGRDEPSTGRIYFYLTDLDYTGQDLMKNNKLTVLFSNDQDLACTKKGIDPMEPTCARIMISGEADKLDVNSDEFKSANRSFISRHPAATNWIATHTFYLCKLEIEQIVVLDWYGGPHYVSVEDYYNANPATNGFLNYGRSVNAVALAEDHHETSSNSIDSTNTRSRNDERIKIRIQKGSDASVTIEL